MINIRYGIFETNSSSTHTLVICEQGKYLQWEEGLLYLNLNTEKLVSASEINNIYADKLESMTVEEKDSWLYENEFLSYEKFNDYIQNSSFEFFEQSFKTESGDEIIAFGYFGYDG